MRINSRDDTLKKNTIQKYQFLIQDDELMKQGKHPLLKRVKDFYTHHGTCPQTFLKYYGRHRLSPGDPSALLPQKRGPRFKTRRTLFESRSCTRMS